MEDGCCTLDATESKTAYLDIGMISLSFGIGTGMMVVCTLTIFYELKVVFTVRLADPFVAGVLVHDSSQDPDDFPFFSPRWTCDGEHFSTNRGDMFLLGIFPNNTLLNGAWCDVAYYEEHYFICESYIDFP